MRRNTFYLLIAFFTVCFSACYYDVEEELYPKIESECSTANLTYEGNIKEIVSVNCAISGCHVAGTGRVDFTTYEGVKQVATNGLMLKKVVIDKSMPPSRPLPDYEISMIENWINQGAPEK